jgi:hypothetical protein
MRKSLILLLLLATGILSAEAQNLRVRPAEMATLKANAASLNRLNLIRELNGSPIYTGGPVNHGPDVMPSGKTNNVNVIQVGQASNPYTILNVRQNQAFANDGMNMVGWIHRQDVSTWGGSPATTANGVLRIDYSLNGGGSWVLDQGPLNPIPFPNTGRPRYPQVAYWRKGGSTMLNEVRFAFIAPLTDGSKWGNIQHGVAHNLGAFCKAVPPTCNALVPPSGFAPTENRIFSSVNYLSNQQDNLTLIPGGLCRGAGNKFYWVDQSYLDSGVPASSRFLDSLVLFRGVVTPNVATGKDTMVVRRFQHFNPDIYVYSNTTNTNDRNIGGWSVAFSPDKKWGWVAMTGDMREPGTVNDQKFITNPLFWYSNDSGATWNGANPNNLNVPIQVKIEEFSAISDSILTTFTNGTSTTGIPSISEFDLVVDSAGNPHMFFNVVNASPISTPVNLDSIYFVSTGARSSMWDLTTYDQGKTWCPKYVAEVFGFQGTIAGTDLDTRTYPQIATNEAGNRVFYSWVSDVNPNLATPTAMAPNLHGQARRIADDATTPVVEYTSGTQSAYPGKIFYPTMAPTVLTRANGQYHPVTIFLTQVNPAGAEVAPSKFGYISDINYTESQFVKPVTDIGVLSVAKPAANLCGGSSDSVVVTVKNYGTGSVNGFRVSYVVNGPISVTTPIVANVPGVLAAGATRTFKFPAVVNLSANGTYQVDISALADFDQNCVNNTLRRTVVNVGGSTNQLFVADTLKGCGTATVNPNLAGVTVSFNNLTAGGSTVSAPTYTLSNVTSSAGNQIEIIATSALCGTRKDTVVVVVNDLPGITLPSDTAGCGGSGSSLSLTIDNSSGTTNQAGIAYKWFAPGGTTPVSTNNTYSVTASGTYRVEIQNTANGCVNTQEVSVRLWDINVNLKQALNTDLGLALARSNRRKPWNTSGFNGATDTLYVCESISMDASNASNNGSTFAWFKQKWPGGAVAQVSSNNFVTTDTAGLNLYYVQITDPLNCKSISDSVFVRTDRTDSIKIRSNLATEFPTSLEYRVGRNHSFTALIDTAPANINASRFFWIVQGGGTVVNGTLGTSGGVLGTNNITLTFPTTGTKRIVLVRVNGSCSDTANRNPNEPVAADRIGLKITVLSATAVDQVALGENGFVNVFPNPTSNNFTLQVGTTHTNPLDMTITDLNGRAILNDSFTVNGEADRQYSLNAVADGIYILRLVTPSGIVTQRIVKSSR